MKVNELYEQVAELGFATSLDSDAGKRFYFAANRALLQVASIRPAVSCCIVNHRPLESLLSDVGEVAVDEERTFEAQGARAYYFEYCGSGTAKLEYYDGDNWQPIQVLQLTAQGSSYVAVRGFVKKEGAFFNGEVRLRFISGDYLYSLKNIAFYKFVYSEKESDIPAFEKYSRYDISGMVDDFWALAAPPVKDDSSFERAANSYDVENERILLLPREMKGTYRVLYKHKPRAINMDDDPENNTDEVDLDAELVLLLPPLIAAYIWIDEEPEKAQYYLNLYRENAMNIERKARNSTPISIHTNGWA